MHCKAFCFQNDFLFTTDDGKVTLNAVLDEVGLLEKESEYKIMTH